MSCPSSCARRRGGASSSVRRRDELRRDDGASESAEPEPEAGEEVALELDAERIVARTQGREGWLREGRRQLEQHRWEEPGSDPSRACGAAAAGGRAAGRRISTWSAAQTRRMRRIGRGGG